VRKASGVCVRQAVCVRKASSVCVRQAVCGAVCGFRVCKVLNFVQTTTRVLRIVSFNVHEWKTWDGKLGNVGGVVELLSGLNPGILLFCACLFFFVIVYVIYFKPLDFFFELLHILYAFKKHCMVNYRE